jgi:sulfonate transport system substrate-binding protein
MKKDFRRVSVLILAVSFLLTIVVAATGCGSTPSSNQANSDKPKFVNGKLTKEFHLKVPSQSSFNEMSIGDRLGFFKEVGLIIDYTGQINGSMLAQSVIKGDNHLFASGHAMTIASARQAGAKLKIVLQGSFDNPDVDKIHLTWLVREDNNIKSAKDLIGKKVAINYLGSCAELLFSEYLRQNDIDRDQVTFVVMPDNQAEQALRQGMIDVAGMHSTFQMVARNRGGVRVLITSYEIGAAAGNGPGSSYSVRAFSEDFIRDNPDVVKAYIAATVKTQHWINNHYDEALKMSADEFKIDPKEVAGNVYPRENAIDPEKINFWIKLMEQNHFIQPGSVDASTLYTNNFNPYLTSEAKE